MWQGRLLPSAGETLMPRLLKGGNPKVPERLLNRVFGVIFLDDSFQPDHNKRNLVYTKALKDFHDLLDTCDNLKAFESFLQRCNRM